MNVSNVIGLSKKAYNEFSEDKAMRLAAALACYTILSLAPLVVITMKISTWVLRDEARTGQVKSQLTQLIGSAGAGAIEAMIASDATQKSGGLALIFSLAILVFSASGVFAELQDSLNTVWEVKPRPDMTIWETIKKRFLSMGMVFGIIFLLLVSMFVTSLLTVVVNKVFGSSGPEATWIGKSAAFIADFVATVLVVGVLFTLIFKYLPDVKIRFKDVWLGGVVTAVLFKIGQYALAFYFAKGSTTSAYGAAGSLVAVLLWAYYSSCILFFGAEFTQVYAKQFGRRIVPDADAVPVTDEERAQHGMPRRQDLGVAAFEQAHGAAQRGGIPRQVPAVPDRRVVTITRPTLDSQKAYAVAGMGIAAGFVVGALGMLTGRKYTGAGLQEIALNERLDRLEKRFGRGDAMRLHSRQLNVHERLDEIEARNRQAQDALRRRARRTAGPSFFERLTAGGKKPTWSQRLSEVFSKN
jgi:membrane protein